MPVSDTIDQTTLLNLVQSGAIKGANVIGQPGGWGVVVMFGHVQKALSVRRGQVRIFRRLDTLVEFLRGIGLMQYQVDASQFDPAKNVRTNAAASLRLKTAHDAAAYEKWFSAEIDQAINEADDPDTQWISNEDAQARWSKRRAELLKMTGGAV